MPFLPPLRVVANLLGKKANTPNPDAEWLAAQAKKYLPQPPHVPRCHYDRRFFILCRGRALAGPSYSYFLLLAIAHCEKSGTKGNNIKYLEISNPGTRNTYF